ncbi:MAG: hypothetical protein B6D64_04925 [Bacteroidetes bacterium 4484_276]|nr:MAG: hypothetical protein B6D64_04925 [Bacteroidetes bacterium 4484_276]
MSKKKNGSVQKKRIEFLEKIENVINDDDLTKLDNVMGDYYLEFQDSVEESKKLIKMYPQFPQSTEYLYHAAIESENYHDEFDDTEIEIYLLNQFIDKGLQLSGHSENGKKFLSKYYQLMANQDMSDGSFEKLSQNKENIIPIFINEINSLMKIRQDKGEVNEKINTLLIGIGKIKCSESANFLNNLLIGYMKELEKYDFEDERNKYINFDFFHIIDCIVKQQNKTSIPHILQARDFFPEEYTDHIICQIAVGRIMKGENNGFLPAEALDISLPAGQIFNMLSGDKTDYKDNFDEVYGKYFSKEFMGEITKFVEKTKGEIS